MARDEATKRYEEMSAAFSRLESRLTPYQPSIAQVHSGILADPSGPSMATAARSTPLAHSYGNDKATARDVLSANDRSSQMPDTMQTKPSSIDARVMLASSTSSHDSQNGPNSMTEHLSLCATAVKELATTIEASIRHWHHSQVFEHSHIAESLHTAIEAIAQLENQNSRLDTRPGAAPNSHPVARATPLVRGQPRANTRDRNSSSRTLPVSSEASTSPHPLSASKATTSWSWTGDEANHFLFSQAENGSAIGDDELFAWSSDVIPFDDNISQPDLGFEPIQYDYKSRTQILFEQRQRADLEMELQEELERQNADLEKELQQQKNDYERKLARIKDERMVVQYASRQQFEEASATQLSLEEDKAVLQRELQQRRHDAAMRAAQLQGPRRTSQAVFEEVTTGSNTGSKKRSSRTIRYFSEPSADKLKVPSVDEDLTVDESSDLEPNTEVDVVNDLLRRWTTVAPRLVDGI